MLQPAAKRPKLDTTLNGEGMASPFELYQFVGQHAQRIDRAHHKDAHGEHEYSGEAWLSCKSDCKGVS